MGRTRGDGRRGPAVPTRAAVTARRRRGSTVATRARRTAIVTRVRRTAIARIAASGSAVTRRSAAIVTATGHCSAVLIACVTLLYGADPSRATAARLTPDATRVQTRRDVASVRHQPTATATSRLASRLGPRRSWCVRPTIATADGRCSAAADPQRTGPTSISEPTAATTNALEACRCARARADRAC